MRKAKYEYLTVIQGNFGFGWEDVSEYRKDNLLTMLNDLKEYRYKSQYKYRFITRRVLKEVV